MDFWVLGSKFTKFLKQQISFSLNFVSLFSVMRRNSSVLFQLKFYILSTKGAYQCTNLVKLQVSSQKSEIFYFDEVLLSKLSNVSCKKVMQSYLSWDWRVMQRLKKNWLVVQIWHEEFGEFSPNQSKVWKFHFDGLFLSKVFKVWAKKNTEESSFMTLSSEARFE